MLNNIFVQESAKSPPFTHLFGVDAKYAKHLRVFGEMCVVADTDNKVGRTKIDPRGKVSLFVGYSTQDLTDYTKCFKAAKDLSKEKYRGIYIGSQYSPRKSPHGPQIKKAATRQHTPVSYPSCISRI